MSLNPFNFFRDAPVQCSSFGVAVPSGCNVEDDEILLKALKLEKDDKPEKARFIYLALAGKENAEAQFRLGVMDLKENPAQAVENIKKAARQGHPGAINQLGMMYKDGQGVEQSYENAFICFSKVADQIPNAKTQIGFFYFIGHHVTKNDVMAFKCFSEAADSDLNAANFLGVMVLHGRGGAQIDYLKAHQLFLSAARRGNHSAALYNLGVIHLMGLGVDKDISIAMQYFKEAANQNYKLALFQLIEIYEQDPDMMKKDPQAGRYYIMAADRGDARAQCKVGQWYDAASARSGTELLHGREKVVGNDLRIGNSLSVTYLEKAARQRNSQAMHILGDKYFHGRGVKVDISLATEYYLSAAGLGDKTVIPKLRDLSLRHQQVKNYLKAFDCSISAAKLGDDNSLYDLRRMHMDGNLDQKNRIPFADYMEEACRLKNPHALFICNYPGTDHLDLAVDKRLLAAQRFLGDFYSQRNSGFSGTHEDYSNAISYYEAIRQQEPSVVPKLAKLYKDGWSRLTVGVKPDGLRAINYYQFAVDHELMDGAEAYKNIAEIYENGIGVEKDMNLAEAYRKRAEAVIQEKKASLN